MQAVGKVVESIYVKEIGATLSKDEIFKILVLDAMEGAIEVDWRDFFPYLGWIPNKGVEMKIQRMHSRRQAVMNALINEAKRRIASGKVIFSCHTTDVLFYHYLFLFKKMLISLCNCCNLFESQQELNCYSDFLLSEANSLTEQQISMLLWETIIETSDTTLVTTEWAIYQLAKDPTRQVNPSLICPCLSVLRNLIMQILIRSMYDRIVFFRKFKLFVGLTSLWRKTYRRFLT